MAANIADYQPTQFLPTSARENNLVQCKSYAPSLPLRPYVASYWHITSRTTLLKTLHHRIMPDGCVDIVFNLAASNPQCAAVVAGPATNHFSTPLTRKVDYLGICFRPGVFFQLFSVPVSELTNRIIPLDDFGDITTRNLADSLQPSDDLDNRIAQIERTLIQYVMRNHHGDQRLACALKAIMESGGSIRIADLARHVHASPRNLLRLFDCFVGLSPKTFCRIVRFQKFFRAIKHDRTQKQLSSALSAGYYDQAHLIHEFQAFAGQSPTRFFAAK
ncbi:MAG TPA: AraC family transcriptional regulator [Thermoguttaceae bacterium]